MRRRDALCGIRQPRPGERGLCIMDGHGALPSSGEPAMNIHIENEEACRLAGDLAELTGESVTGAVTVALRERLAREKRRRDVRARAEDLLAIGERCAKLLGPGSSAAEHGDLLYDERGLPR